MQQKLVLMTAILCTSLISQVGFGDDWPQWGGPQRDLVWRETGIVKTLPTTGLLPRVWSAPLGEGYSGPAVAEVNSRWCVFITDRIFKKRIGYERVLCLDAESGKQIWSYEYPVEYSVSYPAGPRTTPVIDDGRVYTLGAQGHFFCLDVQTGKVIWSKNYVEDFGTKLPAWGAVAAPLIDGNQIISLVGGKQNSLVVSFDKNTGKELWRSLNDPAVGYAPPVIFTFGGKRELIIWHPTAVSALEPKTGKVIWEVPYGVRYGLSIATPRKVGNRLFVASFYNGPRMIEVSQDGGRAKVVWSGKSDSEIKTDGLHPIMMTPIFDGTHIYGVCSYGQLRCLDASNGRRLWETEKATGKGRWWNAFIVPQADRYFLHNEQGELIIANLTPKGYQEVSRAKLLEPTRRVKRRMTIWSHPAFAMKSVFARNDKEIVRVDLSAK